MNIPLRCDCGTVTGYVEARGLYRRYAQCCRKAIGNTSRVRRIPFVTLHVRVLAAPLDEIRRAFGSRGFVFSAESATAPVAKQSLGLLLALPKIFWNVLCARTSVVWRSNPFFAPGSDTPIHPPQQLSQEERHSLRGDQPAS
jgi:hypothetical protein